MVKGYWIVCVDVWDVDCYLDYVVIVKFVFECFGVNFFVCGGQVNVIEGLGWV